MCGFPRRKNKFGKRIPTFDIPPEPPRSKKYKTFFDLLNMAEHYSRNNEKELEKDLLNILKKRIEIDANTKEPSLRDTNT